MNKYLLAGFIFFLAAMILSCSKEKINTDTQNSQTREVKIDLLGEIQMVQKASGSDLYAVQILEADRPSDEGASVSYLPLKAGLFDDVEDLRFTADNSKVYKVNVSVVANGVNVVSKDGDGLFNEPFNGILTAGQLLNTFVDNTGTLENISKGGININNLGLRYFCHDKRYFGSKEGILSEDVRTEITAKIKYFKLAIRTDTDDVMLDDRVFRITVSNSDNEESPLYKSCEPYIVTKAEATSKNELLEISGKPYNHNISQITASDSSEDIFVILEYGKIEGDKFIYEARGVRKIQGVKVKNLYTINVKKISSNLSVTLEEEAFSTNPETPINL